MYLFDVLCCEEIFSGQQYMEDDASREDVTFGAHLSFVFADHLWRKIARSATTLLELLSFLSEDGQPIVNDPGFEGDVVNDDVLELNVSVDDV